MNTDWTYPPGTRLLTTAPLEYLPMTPAERAAFTAMREAIVALCTPRHAATDG